MKIAWFTPFNKKNTIAKYSESVAITLSKYSDVELLVTEQKDLITTSLSKVYYKQDNVLSLLECYDICIYNIGDNSEYNTLIYNVMRQRPGIVILHDLNMFDSNTVKKIYQYSLGVVVNSGEYESKLKSKYAGPVCIVPFLNNNELDNYSEKLFSFIQSVNFLRPLYSLTDLISQELNSMGVSSDMRICETISNEIDFLYGNKK